MGTRRSVRGVKISRAVKLTTPLSSAWLTHNSGRVTQICFFNTVKLGTSASSP